MSHPPRSVKYFFGALLLIALGFVFFRQNITAAPGAEIDKEALRAALQNNPDILLEFMDAHKQEVLDIVQKAAEERRTQALSANWDSDAKQPKEINLKGRAIRGDKNAPVTIVAYSDFLCPYCGEATVVIEDVLKEYPKDVRFVFKNYPLVKIHPAAELSAKYFIAASMQNETKALEFHDLLFQNQTRLARDGEAYLQEAAKSLGFDMERLKKDALGDKAAAMLEEDRAEARRMGIKGAPFLVINDLIFPGAPDKDILIKAVQKALSLK